MSNPSVPLSMLVTKDVPYEWHDAVALTAQLVAQVRTDVPFTQGRVPDLRGISLEHTGTLIVTLTPGHSAPGMPGAAQILQQLLSGKDQPAQLRLFAMQIATAEPAPTLEVFAEELAKWERPNRLPKLSALYHRALEQIGPAALTEEARSREERSVAARKSADSASAKKGAKKDRAPGLSRGAIAALAVGGVLVIGAAAWIATGRPIPFLSEVRRVAAALEAPEESASDTTIETGGAPPATGTPPAPPAPPRRRPTPDPQTSPVVTRAEDELARARALFGQREYAATTARIDDVMRMLDTENSPQAEEIRQIARSLDEVARAAVIQDAAMAALEFRSGDPGVVDPVALSYLPRKPDPNTSPEKLQVLEIHVNTDGTVDSAKWVINRPSFRNAWWTSAAKAWHFKPATKDGRPVRFVMRIVMDDLGTP